MQCSVFIAEPQVLEQGFLSFSEERGIGIESQDLVACAVAAQSDLLEAFAAVRPQAACSWSGAFLTVFSVLFWQAADGHRQRDASWAVDCEQVDTYLAPASVSRLAQVATSIHLDDLNRSFAEALPDAFAGSSGDGWIQDFNDFRAMASEWLDLVALASERGHALAIAVWE